MKKFLLGLAAGFVLAGLASVVAFFALARIGEKRPSVPDGATLVWKLSGEVPESAPPSIPLPMFESRSALTVHETWDALRKAEVDGRIKALVVEPVSVSAGWAKIQELREAIVRFKRSGKPVYAHLRTPQTKDYYIASAADKIYLTPEDFLYVKGLRAEVSYYKRTLDKVGVEFEVEYAGRYKDGMDTLVRDGMTAETREVITALVDGLFGHWVETVAAGRKKTPEQIRAAVDQGPILSGAAAIAGLIDGLKFEDEVFDEVKERLKQDKLHKFSLRDYSHVPASSVGLAGKSTVALVIGQGEITRGDDIAGTDDDGIRSASFVRMLRQVEEDASIKGAILRIDSPGGDAIASEEILHQVKRLSKKKPMVISMSDVAASGGYYIAMTGDPVVAYRNTIAGSIGVYFGKLNARALHDKLGVRTEVIERGRNAGIDSIVTPVDEQGRRKLKDGVEATYRAVLSRVADGRKKKVEEIEPLAQGRVYLGSKARDIGLVDEIGGLDRAIELMKGRLKIDAKEHLRLTVYPRRKSVLDQIFGSPEDLLAEMAQSRLRAMLSGLGVPYRDPATWGRGAIMAIAPYSLRIE